MAFRRYAAAVGLGLQPWWKERAEVSLLLLSLFLNRYSRGIPTSDAGLLRFAALYYLGK